MVSQAFIWIVGAFQGFSRDTQNGPIESTCHMQSSGLLVLFKGVERYTTRSNRKHVPDAIVCVDEACRECRLEEALDVVKALAQTKGSQFQVPPPPLPLSPLPACQKPPCSKTPIPNLPACRRDALRGVTRVAHLAAISA